jgi:hypothetical protein
VRLTGSDGSAAGWLSPPREGGVPELSGPAGGPCVVPNSGKVPRKSSSGFGAGSGCAWNAGNSSSTPLSTPNPASWPGSGKPSRKPLSLNASSGRSSSFGTRGISATTVASLARDPSATNISAPRPSSGGGRTDPGRSTTTQDRNRFPPSRPRPGGRSTCAQPTTRTQSTPTQLGALRDPHQLGRARQREFGAVHARSGQVVGAPGRLGVKFGHRPVPGADLAQHPLVVGVGRLGRLRDE